MDWTQRTRAELRNESYNPDEVWTIEGPTRKAQERLRRKNAMVDLKNSLETQAVDFRTTILSERDSERNEGRVLNEDDLRIKEDED